MKGEFKAELLLFFPTVFISLNVGYVFRVQDLPGRKMTTWFDTYKAIAIRPF